ncbi:hypothetical protein [Aquimarina pacifica]|uniref:hypothetical protein n=1 Tax=Aquimarina pacifica TaxID=1296415 RepID=UPI00047154D9|nr:hypothetical protein [Aquimarina pacifica]
MKKFIYLAAFTLALGFTSCGSDDDGDSNCETCDVIGISITMCDNGDGTADVSAAGQTETVDLEGVSFDAYVEATCSATISF